MKNTVVSDDERDFGSDTENERHVEKGDTKRDRNGNICEDMKREECVERQVELESSNKKMRF